MEKNSFQAALHFLKEGAEAKRTKWSGSRHIQIVSAGNISFYESKNHKTGEMPLSPFICEFSYSGEGIPWVPSQEDLLAEDWIIIK